MQKSARVLPAAALVAVLLCSLTTGCGDDSDGDDAGMEAPSFATVKMRVFTTGCAFDSCHDADNPAAGLDLQTDPYLAIIDTMSAVANKPFITPGDPEASYLYEKISVDMPTAGVRMPQNGTLEPERIEIVRAWIASGAKND